MAKIEVRCPICSKKGKMEVSEDLIKQTTRGLIAINVTENLVCEHSFIAYVDKNLAVRDYFIPDFQITLPEASQVETEQEEAVSTAELLNLESIRMNLPDVMLIYIIRAILLKEQVVIISDHSFLFNHIINFFKYITQNSFENDIFICSIVDYMKNKKQYEEAIVLGRNEVLKDIKKVIDPKKLKVVRNIVEKFLAETDLMSSLIILKNEIQKAYDLAKKTVDFINQIEEKEEFNSKLIINHLKEVYDSKISMNYLDFLLEIVEDYFGVIVPKGSDGSKFLGRI